MAYNSNPYSPYGLQTQMFQPQPQFQQPDEKMMMKSKVLAKFNER